MGRHDSSTPTCDGRHLVLGQACLEVASNDSQNTLQLWAQSDECYKCPPWYYFTLEPNTTHTMAINTTHPTSLVITNAVGRNLYKFDYHFGLYGNYHLLLDAQKPHGMDVTRQPESEALPLFTAILFFVLLAFMWLCTKFLVRRMDSSATAMRAPDTERSPLIPRRPYDQPSVLADPQPSTSQPSDSEPSVSQPSDSQPSTSQPSVPALRPDPVPLDGRRETGRLKSLDAFRGLAIVLMIFVNYGGGGYWFFKHARWNGLTVADLVFPWFLWIMGVSLVFSIRSQLRRATKRIVIVARILKRCLILFFLGLIVNSVGDHNYMPTFRILGVLQRFAICYFLTAVIEVYTMNPQESPEYIWYWKIRDIVRSSPQWVYTLVLLIIHTTLTFGLPVPHCAMGYLGPGGLHEWGMHRGCTGGAAGYIDRIIFGRSHVYSHPTCVTIYDSNTPYDPEGLLGALTSVLMVQFGAACGRIITTYQTHRGRWTRWLIWALVTGLLAGFLCGWRKEGGLIPVNKNLWSLSYVLSTTCFAFILFTIFYILIDERGWWLGNPLRYAGMNSIFLYVGHEICGGLFPWSWKPVGQYHANQLIMNLWATSSWVMIAYLLHKRKLYFSV